MAVVSWDRNVGRAVKAIRGDVESIRAAMEQAEGKRYESFREYTDAATRGRFEWYRHCQVVADRLQDVADGRIKRLMIFEPPRHGKTEQASRLFPGYILQRFPEKWVGITSYSGELARAFGRAARGHYREAGGVLSEEASAAREWETGQGGGAWSAGVLGTLTGRGFDWGILDDPIKSAEEADNELLREKLHEWYRTVFYTRAEPGAAIIIILTRWHPDDLAGWLLEREPEAKEGWHILNLPARAEEEPQEFPDTCTVEPDWRGPGEPLCPERFGDEALEGIEAAIGPRAWASLYQQRPTPREGLFFKGSWFERVDELPEGQRYTLVRYWDTAGTDGRGDYTVGVLMARGRDDGLFYVVDVVRGQWSPGQRDARIRATAERDRAAHGKVTIWLEREAGVAGEDRTRATVAQLAGFTVKTERPTGSKEDRADPLEAQAEVGNVKLVRGEWNTAFLDELCAFPHAKHDDQVDAASGAFSKVSRPTGSAVYVNSPWGPANAITNLMLRGY